MLKLTGYNHGWVMFFIITAQIKQYEFCCCCQDWKGLTHWNIKKWQIWLYWMFLLVLFLFWHIGNCQFFSGIRIEDRMMRFGTKSANLDLFHPGNWQSLSQTPTEISLTLKGILFLSTVLSLSPPISAKAKRKKRFT